MKSENLTNNRLGLFLTAILLTNFCLAQTKYEKDLEFNLNFSSDSVIRLSKDENSELFNAVKKIVYVDLNQIEYPNFRMRISCKIDMDGEIISLSIKSFNMDTEVFIEKDMKSLFNRIKKFNITGITLNEKKTDIIFILDAWQTIDKFIFIGGLTRLEGS